MFSQRGPFLSAQIFTNSKLIHPFRQHGRPVTPDSLEFQSHASWSLTDTMTPTLHLGESQLHLIEELLQYLRADEIRHIRLIGEPGLGKTRLILEATSKADLSPLVIYVSNAEDFQKSHFFHVLLRSDNQFYVILVIDECPSKERASIWDTLKGRSDRCRLITIDHGPEVASDSLMKVIDCPHLADEQIAAILMEYVPDHGECRRWAKFCGGSPRVAHLVGQNLRENPEDILRPPGTVAIWDRFIAGYDRQDSTKIKKRQIVLQCISLFLRFGFESPVELEAQFISKLAQEIDNTLTWPEFQSIVYELKKKRILQGKTTLFIVPKALHVYLWLEFWNNYGRSYNIGDLYSILPGGLKRWFIEMFIYTHTSPVAQKKVVELLGTNGPFKDSTILKSEVACKFLDELAEGSPDETLSCIERIIGQCDHDTLLHFDRGRQDIIWALEKLAIWSDYFNRASRVLLKLAISENSNHGGNATGTLTGLFSLAYGGLAPTEASPQQRFPILKAILTSTIPEERLIGLKASKSALSTYHGHKIIGPEYQGLRPVAKLWLPKTWGEIYEAYLTVLLLLNESRKTWTNEEKTEASIVLIDSSIGLMLLDNQQLSDVTLMILDTLVDEETTDVRKMIAMITRILKYHKDKITTEIVANLERLEKKITGTTFESRLRRAVLLSDYGEYEYDKEGKRCDNIDEIIDTLASESIKYPNKLSPILNDIIQGNYVSVYDYGYNLAKYDATRIFLPEIIDKYRVSPENTNPLFLSGYLRAIFDSDINYWESVITELIADSAFKQSIVEIVWRSGITNSIISKLILSLKQGQISTNQFQYFSLGRSLQDIEPEIVSELITCCIASGEISDISIGLEMADHYYCDKNENRAIPKDLNRKLLLNPVPFVDHNASMDYHWANLAEYIIKQNTSLELEIFRYAMKYCEDWRSLNLHFNFQTWQVIYSIAKKHPQECWEIIISRFQDLKSDITYGIQRWLGSDPKQALDQKECAIDVFPIELILSWIEQDSETRAPFIADVAPKSIDPNNNGNLTRELLARYGNLPRVKSSILRTFLSGGYCGSGIEHYRGWRDKARKWLENETSQNVINWLQEYIVYLNGQIEREEIEEERRF